MPVQVISMQAEMIVEKDLRTDAAELIPESALRSARYRSREIIKNAVEIDKGLVELRDMLRDVLRK
jgi:hypothetical protein